MVAPPSASTAPVDASLGDLVAEMEGVLEVLAEPTAGDSSGTSLSKEDTATPKAN